MKRHKTNVEFVTHLMEFSRFGALSQLFIVDAISKRAEHIANMPIEKLVAAFGPNSIIHPEAWHGVAKEIHQAFEERK